eukprot:scaffold5055_cov210-Alexandrium_tamarense.AAC.4
MFRFVVAASRSSSISSSILNERNRKKQDEDVRALGGLVSRQNCKQLYLLVNEATTASVAS